MSVVSLNIRSLKTWQDLNLEGKRYEYDVNPGEKILDIGSYQGEWSNEMIKRYGCKAECFDALDNRAAWIHDGKIEMGGQYYYTSMYDKGEQGPVNSFKCVDIAPFLQEEIAVMKINIEGSEYTLLAYIISKQLQKNVRNFQIQFHQIADHPYDLWYEEISKQLSLTHRLVWRYPYCWESWQLI